MKKTQKSSDPELSILLEYSETTGSWKSFYRRKNLWTNSEMLSMLTKLGLHEKKMGWKVGVWFHLHSVFKQWEDSCSQLLEGTLKSQSKIKTVHHRP